MRAEPGGESAPAGGVGGADVTRCGAGILQEAADRLERVLGSSGAGAALGFPALPPGILGALPTAQVLARTLGEVGDRGERTVRAVQWDVRRHSSALRALQRDYEQADAAVRAGLTWGR